jgi:hypothetical protein
MKKGIVLSFTVSVFIAILSGCGAGTGYHFKMAASSTLPAPPPTMIYSDDLIDISFTVAEADEKGVEGDRQYDQYKGVSFILNNKTDHALTIDWNKIAFKDFRGSSGNAVMYKNRNYKECATVKPSTVVPPKGKIEDVIIPCYGVVFTSGANAHWDLSFLPSPRVSPTVDFGIYMPLQFGKNIKSYGFNFIAESRSVPGR